MNCSATASSVGAATAAAAGATKSPLLRSTTSKLMKSSPLFSLVTGMNCSSNDLFDATAILTGILPNPSLFMRNATSKPSCKEQSDWVQTDTDHTNLASGAPSQRRFEIGSNSTNMSTGNTSVVRSSILNYFGALNATSKKTNTAGHVMAIVPGLPNLGNTCFVNALLQALASLDPFHEFLNELTANLGISKTPQKKNPCTSARLIHSLHICMQVLREVTTYPRAIDKHIIGDIMRPLRESNASFCGYDQQDAEELLQSLMSEVDDGLQIVNSAPPQEAIGLASLVSPQTDSDSDEEGGGEIDDKEGGGKVEAADRLRNPLQGLVASILDCTKCHRRSPTRNAVFYDIQVSLTRCADQVLTVHDCLHSYFMREKMDDFECTGCASRHTEKRLILSRLPKCLCIHFRRRTYTQKGPWKVRTRVRFGKILNMTSYYAQSHFRDFAHVDKGSSDSTAAGSSATPPKSCDNAHDDDDSKPDSAPLLYSLTAVIVHDGTANSGHFFAYRRVARDVWIEASDTQVKQVDEKSVLDAEAYMLFYVQQNVSPSEK